MIPKVPVLARRTFNSGFSSSHYNPRSLFTRVLSANSGDEFGFGDTFDYNATVVHERVHWLQHLGTSFGAFLEALRYSQIRTTLRWFNRIPNSTVDEMLASRKAGVKKILALDPQTSLPIFETGKDEYDLNLFREIWFGHQWLHSLFEDSRSVEKLCRPSGDLIGEVIGDVMLALCGDAGFDCSMKSEIVNDPIAARKWFSVEPPVAFVRMGDLRITSSVLMEAAATIAELILLPSGLWPAVVSESDFRDAASARINKIFNSSYGIPVKALLHELGMRGNMQQVIATANVLCFVALNPPLPPFVMQPPVDRAAWSWSDIYPPIRFATLCHAVKRLGLIGSCRDQNTLFAYINDITQLASVPTSLNYQFPETTPLCSVPDFDSKGFPEYSAAPHYEYLFWAQSKLASLRQDSLPMLASFGDCMSGELFKNHVDLIIAVDDGYAPFARCPLSWTSNDKVGYSCTVNLGNWLITSSALHNSFFDVVVGTGEFDLGFYPADVRNSGFASGLEDSISMNLMGGWTHWLGALIIAKVVALLELKSCRCRFSIWLRVVVVCRKANDAVRDGRGGTRSTFASKYEVPPPRLSVMDGVCLNDNSRNLGGGGSTPSPRPSPIKSVPAGVSRLQAMATANRTTSKVCLLCTPSGTAFGTGKTLRGSIVSCLRMFRRHQPPSRTQSNAERNVTRICRSLGQIHS